MENATSLFKSLSEPVRLRILNLLDRGVRDKGELCVCDLMAVLGLPQSTVSRHLGRLARSGLVTARRQGRWTYYRLARSGEIRWVRGLCREMLAASRQASDDLRSLEQRMKISKTDRCG